MSAKLGIIILLVVLDIIFVIVFRKEILKLLLCLVLLVTGVIAVNIFYPEKLQQVGSYVQHVSELKDLASSNEYVKLDFEKDSKTKIKDVEVKVNDKWYALGDIKNMVQNKDGTYSITVGGQGVSINEKEVINALNTIKELK